MDAAHGAASLEAALVRASWPISGRANLQTPSAAVPLGDIRRTSGAGGVVGVGLVGRRGGQTAGVRLPEVLLLLLLLLLLLRFLTKVLRRLMVRVQIRVRGDAAHAGGA